MDLFRWVVSHLFGRNPLNRVAAAAVFSILVVARIATPHLFGQALHDYSQRTATTYVNGSLKPRLDAMEKSMDKQFRDARMKQQQQQFHR
jgi:hypothetical protein